MNDTKLRKVRFLFPVDVLGMGMVHQLNLTPEAVEDTPALSAVHATLVDEGRWLRISTSVGETLIPIANLASVQPQYEDRVKAAAARKAVAAPK